MAVGGPPIARIIATVGDFREISVDFSDTSMATSEKERAMFLRLRGTPVR
jgi:hypothetical protein